jgi:hypothetical protein
LSDPIQCALENGLSWADACDIGTDQYYLDLAHASLARQTLLAVEPVPARRTEPSAVIKDAEQEECRFFNTPRGCREGDDCDYLHIKRSMSDLRCRFLDTPRGCNPGFGRRCPYKH